MRIAVLHNHPIHYKHLLFTKLVELDAEVDVLFAARSSKHRTASLQPAGVSYRSHFLSEGNFESLPQIRSAIRAVKVIARCRPDVVIISGYSYLPTWSTLAWAKLCGKPVVLWFESNIFDHPRHIIKESIKRIFVHACDSGQVYGQSNRRYLEYLGMKPSRILEKRATFDSAVFSKRRAEFHSDFRRFVYVGRFSPEKNLPRLLEAFRIVMDDRRAELVLVGYGPDEPMLRQRTQELGLEDSVVFAGPKTQDEVSAAMSESDCFVLPSLSEPWGLVINEAQATGLPVIVSDRCGCALDLAGRSHGWTFDAKNTAELAETMLKVCGMSLERLQQMGQVAVEKATEYTPEACAKRIFSNLEELSERCRTSKGLANGNA